MTMARRQASIVWEIAASVGAALGVAFGRRFHEEHVVPQLEGLAVIDLEHPFPPEHLRKDPMEFEEVEGVRPEGRDPGAA
jgi:hypothetical protein